jgi:hypothetical protein
MTANVTAIEFQLASNAVAADAHVRRVLVTVPYAAGPVVLGSQADVRCKVMVPGATKPAGRSDDQGIDRMVNDRKWKVARRGAVDDQDLSAVAVIGPQELAEAIDPCVTEVEIVAAADHV